MSTTQYGHLVRMWGIDPSNLPPTTATSEELTPLLNSVLLEALPFLDDVPPPSFTREDTGPWKRSGVKKFSHSTSEVEIFQRTVTTEDLQAVAQQYHLADVDTTPEFWALRRSVHEDAAVTGTASWDEWWDCFKARHAEAEVEFTPSVLDTHVLQEWKGAQGVQVTVDGDVWEDWTMKHEESRHKMPAPLKHRVFPVVQFTASVRGRREFVVVQVVARSKSSTGGDGGKDTKDAVVGAYTSVERVRETEHGLEWVMGTVSDAKGAVPGWVQKLAAPGMVAKDVDMFLDWIARERRKGRRFPGGGDGGTQPVEAVEAPVAAV